MSGDRDTGMDALRVVAIAGVVLGHWLVTAPALGADGVVRLDSPLRTMPGLAPASWAFQTLGLFFLVAGSGAARSRAGSAEPPARWWWRRVRALAGPVAVLVGGVAVVAAALALHGAAQSVVRTVVVLSLSPLWFLGVHLTLLAATPLLVRLDARLGAGAVAVPVVLAVAAPLGGDALAATAVVTGWWVPWQLGVALARCPLRPRTGWLLFTGGGAAVLLLVLVAGFPGTAVGVRGAATSNLDPPSAATVALALAQAGLATVLLPRLAALGRHRLVTGVGRAALPVFLLHLPVLAALWLVALPVAPLPGLHDVPAGPGWLLARSGWLLGTAAVLAVVLTGVRRCRGSAADDALPAGARSHGLGDGGSHPPVQRTGHDVARAEVLAHHVGDGRRSRQLHLLGDAVRPGADGPAEHPGEGQHAIDLAGQVAAPGGDEGGVAGGHHRVDLGRGVGQ